MASTYNVTAEYVKANSLNSDLTGQEDAYVTKLIKRAISLVSVYADLEQFNNGSGSYTLPDDLIDGVMFVVEILFVNNGMFEGPATMQSERIGDYSYDKGTKKDKGDSIDLPLNIKAILAKYRSNVGYIEPSIAGCGGDRVYEDDVTGILPR